MTHRTQRLRRAIFAAAVGAATAGGFGGLAAGTAGTAAAAQSTDDSITATSQPRITPTGAKQAAGDLTIVLHDTTGAELTTSHLKLSLSATGGGVVTWSSQGVTASTATKAAAGADGTPTLTVTVSMPSGKTATVSVKTVEYDSSAAHGTVRVTPSWKSATTATVGTFTAPGYAVNAIAAQTTPAPKPVTATRVYGPTADATAAKELEYRFPATSATKCPGTGKTSTGTGSRAVVLANDTHFPDALSGAYLASVLHTGILLTPYAKVSSVTLTALRLEGITHVYVLGGPLAITSTVVTQLTSTPAYTCGGTSVRHTSSGAARDLEVTRIGGKTQYDTSKLIATFVTKSNVGTGRFAGAYAGVDASGGNGKYNDTKGSGSPAPSSAAAMKTAVVATGNHFQDAMSASAMSYKQHFPVLLTTTLELSAQVATAISTLGIGQVIVMGGPLAVTNAVVTSLEGDGVSVLRIAGADATDTAARLAEFELNTTAAHTLLHGGLGLGWDPHGSLAVARGNGFTDALAGSVVTGGNAWPQLLTEDQTTPGPYLTAFLKSAGRTGSGVDHTTGPGPSVHGTALVVFGGPLAVTPQATTQMENDLG